MAITAYRLGTNKQKYRATILEDNPVAYWRLGDVSGTTAVDEMGAYNGTIVGSPALGQKGVIPGNGAIDFIGGTRYVSNASAGNFTSTPFTIEMWVYARSFTSSSGDSMIFSKGRFNVGGYYSTVTSNGKIDINTNQVGGWQFSSTSNGAAPLNTWLHVAVTFSGSTAKIYVNAVDKTTTSGVHTQPATSADPFTIGNHVTGSWTPSVIIDEVAIYPTALSASRILAHYQAAI